jgi:hypothetical protein
LSWGKAFGERSMASSSQAILRYGHQRGLPRCDPDREASRWQSLTLLMLRYVVLYCQHCESSSRAQGLLNGTMGLVHSTSKHPHISTPSTRQSYFYCHYSVHKACSHGKSMAGKVAWTACITLPAILDEDWVSAHRGS